MSYLEESNSNINNSSSHSHMKSTFPACSYTKYAKTNIPSIEKWKYLNIRSISYKSKNAGGKVA